MTGDSGEGGWTRSRSGPQGFVARPMAKWSDVTASTPEARSPQQLVRALIDRAADATDEAWMERELPGWIDAALADVDPSAILDFVRGDARYSFACWEVAGQVCAKPREVVAAVLARLVPEIVDEERWVAARLAGGSKS